MISVIIPNFNHSAYLKQRIDSVLDQTFQNFELIILDDCSTDNSRSIIELYKDHPKVSIIKYNEKNSGSVFKQWQKGIELSSGEYIWIAESDDWAEKNFLEAMIAKLEGDSEVGIVYCDSNIYTNGIYTERFSERKRKWLKNDKWLSDYENKGLQEIKDSLIKACSINNASAVLFRKESIMKANIFDKTFRYAGDWYAYLKVLLKSDISYIGRPLNNYRAHEKNASKNALKDDGLLIECFIINEWILKNIKGVNKRTVYKSFYEHVLPFFLPSWNISITAKLARISPVLLLLTIVYKVQSFLNNIFSKANGLHAKMSNYRID